MGEPQNPTLNPPTTAVKLEIIYDLRNGAVGVNVPNELLNNVVLAYGLLEVARQTIGNFVAQKQKDQRIIPANVLPLVRPA